MCWSDSQPGCLECSLGQQLSCWSTYAARLGLGQCTQFSILKTQRICLQEKGGGTGPWHWNMQGIEYAAARERHILAPLYAVPLPRYYCRKISIQGAALHKVGPQTCAAPCCCIKWRLAYCGAMGLRHPFFQGGNPIVFPPL